MSNYQWEGGWHSREELHHGVVTSDGNYVGCGYCGYRTTGSDQEILLLKVDTLGNEIWHRFYENNDRAKYGESVKETPDRGFIITGSYYSDDTCWLYLLKTDSLGYPEWDRMFISDQPTLIRCTGYDIELADDGGYLIAGRAGWACNTGYLYLAKTDSLGNKEWEKVYANSSMDLAFGVDRTSDGGYIITGYTSLGNRYLWLLKTNSSGDTLWTRIMGGGMGAWGEAGLDVAETPDCGYIVAGYTYSYSANPGNQRDGWLVRTDSLGDSVWARAYPGNHGVGGSLASVRNMPGGGYLAGGTDDANDSDGWMLRTDPAGNVRWQNSWGDVAETGWDHVNCVQPTADGGVIGFGSSYTYATPSFDAWLIKADSSGLVGVGESGPGSNRPARPTLSVVPNPMAGPGRIAFAVPHAGPVRIDLCDVGGRKIRTIHRGEAGDSGTARFDARGISSGVYVIRLVSDGGSAAQRITVVGSRREIK
ncbi:T9SS type A sorting domain-containing protein [candidate division WOR-3 bacterium]|nr:T9SS type A sorting domain-containing protein [candidate division WOR-3 bacterium]